MKLSGKVALVTGASRGIGKAVALALATNGADVAVNYHQHSDAAEDVAKTIRDMGRKAVTIQADVRNLDKVREMITTTKQELGQLDILVNNAGVVRDNLVTFMKDEEWDVVLDTNLKGAFYCIKVAAKEMMRTRSGRIINISSDAGLMGDAMRANYSAAKAGMLGLTKAAARELAASGITVNAIAPGVIETDLIAEMSAGKRSAMLALIPQSRFGTPDDIAGPVVFLASDDSSYMTGQVVCVDGGLRMG